MRHSDELHVYVGLTMRMAMKSVPMDPYDHHRENEDNEDSKEKDDKDEQHDEDEEEEGMRVAWGWHQDNVDADEKLKTGYMLPAAMLERGLRAGR